MKCKVKKKRLSSGGPLIAIMHETDAQKLGIHPLDRIQIKKTAVVVNLTCCDIKPGYIGLFIETWNTINVKENEIIDIQPAKKPLSLKYIKQKLDGYELNEEEMQEIIKDINRNNITEIEATYFVAGCYRNGMTLNESAALTKAIVKNSGQIRFHKYPIVDKHSVGGVPGNRTTPIIVAIVAAAGLRIPKTSTRSITSPAGTADTMEVLAPVEFTAKEIKEIAQKTGGCLVWGGTKDLASADDKLIKLEKPLRLDPEGILLASILAKKSAVESSHILIDIPYGTEAKIETRKEALRLKKRFTQLGKKLGLRTQVMLTEGSEPIGNGIGPALEARDVLLVLQDKGPEDLKKKSLIMAAKLMKMVGIKNAKKRATDILKSGEALLKLQEIIKAQGGKPKRPEDISLGKYTYTVKAKKVGKITHISNKEIARIAFIAGAPQDKGAGVYLHVHKGAKVTINQSLYTIYAEHANKLTEAKKEVKEPIEY